MKKFLILLSLLISGATTTFAGGLGTMPMLTHGLYVGLGGSWNTIDESFHSTLVTSLRRSARDNYHASHSRLAPMVQVGYWAPFCQCWLWGAAVQWKYLHYLTPNDSAPQGEHLPNATFSSINIFGPKVERDFNSRTKVSNEVLFLLYAGKQFQNGYAYLGIGPVLFTTLNSMYVFSIHRPDGVGDHLSSNSVTRHKTIWGGTIQAGYNYYLDPTFFLNFNYTFSQTGTNKYKNSVNTATFNGFFDPGPTTLFLKRKIKLRVQEVMFSINKVFDC